MQASELGVRGLAFLSWGFWVFSAIVQDVAGAFIVLSATSSVHSMFTAVVDTKRRGFAAENALSQTSPWLPSGESLAPFTPQPVADGIGVGTRYICKEPLGSHPGQFSAIYGPPTFLTKYRYFHPLLDLVELKISTTCTCLYPSYPHPHRFSPKPSIPKYLFFYCNSRPLITLLQPHEPHGKMAKSSRASTLKVNNQRLKKNVFGPVEAARNERLSAKLLALAAEPKPQKDIEMNEGTFSSGTAMVLS